MVTYFVRQMLPNAQNSRYNLLGNQYLVKNVSVGPKTSNTCHKLKLKIIWPKPLDKLGTKMVYYYYNMHYVNCSRIFPQSLYKI